MNSRVLLSLDMNVRIMLLIGIEENILVLAPLLIHLTELKESGISVIIRSILKK